MSLASDLVQLETADLVRRLEEAELTYQFRHALTQDAAYALLLKNERIRLHRMIAQAYELFYADRLDENAAVLAEHYAVAGLDAKAMEYLMRAGAVAGRVYAHTEALAHYARALNLARRDPQAPSQLLCDLLLRRGRMLELSSQFKAALEHYKDMQALAQTRGDRALELAALAAQCQIRCTPNPEFNPDLGEELAKQTAAFARDLGDRPVEAKVYWDLLNAYRLTNRLAQALEAGERSIAIARELNLREQLAFSLNDISHVHMFSGDFNRSRITVEEATRLWRELDNLPMLADSLATLAQYGSFSGDYENALELGAEALKISQSIANLWGQTYSLSAVGIIYWVRGDPGRAIATMEETLRLSDLSGYLIPQELTRADLAVVYARLGDTVRGIELAERALEFSEANYEALSPYAAAALVQTLLLDGQVNQAAARLKLFEENERNYTPFFAAYITLGQLHLAIAQKDYMRVLKLAPEILSKLHAFGLRAYLPEVLYILAQAQGALGQAQEAEKSLNQARVEAELLGARWDLWQIFGAIAGIEAARGNERVADICRDRARQIIADIVEHLPVSSLRDSFLSTPQVRPVVGEGQYVGK